MKNLIEAVSAEDADPQKILRTALGKRWNRGALPIQLSPVLFESLRRGYCNGVDLDYVNRLKSPLAQRLYLYLTKKDHQRLSYVESLKTLATKMNLRATKPSAIKEALVPALRTLSEGRGGSRSSKQFLRDWQIEDGQVQVSFLRSTVEHGSLTVASLRQRLRTHL